MKFSIKIALLFVMFSSIHNYAQSTYEFLRLDMSARAAALAGSFVANSDDPNVIFYNPAGIKFLQNTPVSFSFTKHLMDINSAAISASREIEGFGRFGAAIQYVNYGSFTEADEVGNKLGEFGANDLAVLIGYANNFNENIYYGASAKLIYSQIADVASAGLAFDLGAQYVIPDENWTFGISILNLGTQINYYAESREDLPLDLRLGASKQFAYIPLRLSVSFNKLTDYYDNFSDRFKQFAVGGEFKLSQSLKLRLGYDNEKRKELKIGTTAGIAGFNIGFGLNVSDYMFDYAFSSLGSIGAIHRLGISTVFN